jgi:hypothetical protein
VARISYETAYPGVQFWQRSRNWWAWLKGTPAECVHLEHETAWTANLLPDTLYLRGKRREQRVPARPEVSLCRACLLEVMARDLRAYAGRVVAFEPDADVFTQCFFVAVRDFERAGLAPEVIGAIERRLERAGNECASCQRPATWLWFSRAQVASLDETEKIDSALGECFCSAHGARKFCEAFEHIAEANVFYINLPYGEAGAYVWI